MRSTSSCAMVWRSRILATTWSGALDRKASLPNFAPVCCSSFSALARSFSKRLRSASTSMASEVSKDTSTVPCDKRTSMLADAVKSASGAVILARLRTKSSWLPKSTAAKSKRPGTFCEGLTPWSARKRRNSVMSFSESSMRRSATSSAVAPPLVSAAVGHGAIMMDSACLPSVSACHRTSVTKGMVGCSRRSTTSNTRPNTICVLRPVTDSPSRGICVLAISKYQSHSSSHAKW